MKRFLAFKVSFGVMCHFFRSNIEIYRYIDDIFQAHLISTLALNLNLNHSTIINMLMKKGLTLFLHSKMH